MFFHLKFSNMSRNKLFWRDTREILSLTSSFSITESSQLSYHELNTSVNRKEYNLSHDMQQS